MENTFTVYIYADGIFHGYILRHKFLYMSTSKLFLITIQIYNLYTLSSVETAYYFAYLVFSFG